MKEGVMISGRRTTLGEDCREKLWDRRMLAYRGHFRKMWRMVRDELQCEQVGEGSLVNR